MTEAGRKELRRLERNWSQDEEKKKDDCSKKSLRTSSRKIGNR